MSRIMQTRPCQKCGSDLTPQVRPDRRVVTCSECGHRQFGSTVSRHGGVPLGIGVTACLVGWASTLLFAFIAIVSSSWWLSQFIMPLMFLFGPAVSVILTTTSTARRARARGDVQWKRVAIANSIVIGIIAAFVNFVLCLALFMLLATLFPIPA